ncbi:MAG: Maf family protein, partial [Planctomycetota bacterium]
MLILASASNARRALLAKAGFAFRVVPSAAREVRRDTLRATVVENAKRKAAAVARKHPVALVLAADTMISFRGQLFGKPRSRKAAVSLLEALAGRTHVLGTGVVLRRGGREIVRYAASRVTLRRNAPVAKILGRADPTRFAGGYAIQEGHDPLVERIAGSRSNVIGLPMEIVAPLLERLGVPRRGCIPHPKNRRGRGADRSDLSEHGPT